MTLNATCRLLVILPLVVLMILSGPAWAEDTKPPSLMQIHETVEAYFRALAGHRANDLISRSQVEQVLKSLRELGWQIPDGADLLNDVLEDQHILVSALRTSAGHRFMGKVSGRELMYDRLDRISAVSGGPQLIQDLVKLPNGEKYAKPRSGGGVPDLLDLLPKNASGKTRRIADYHKPTGRLYTASDLKKRLAEIHAETEATKTPAN